MEPHEFWQELHPGEDDIPPPWADRYPARLPDGRILFLPIRALGDGGTGIASLILNQAGFAVEATLAQALAERLDPLDLDVVVGMPTLGLSLARLVAERLGHARYVPLGTSRKFWYSDDLSVPLTSITSPNSGKRLYVDPRMLPLLANARVCLVDDVISTGTSISAGLTLLGMAGISARAVGAAMLQTDRWAPRLARDHALPDHAVHGVIRSPLLIKRSDGWHAAPETGD